MRKLTFLLSAMFGTLTLAGCVNEIADRSGEGTSITLTAGIEATDATKTDISDPMNPIWSEGDAIGLHFFAGETLADANVRLDGTFTPDFATATFEGSVELSNDDYTIYGYYPYGTAGDATANYGMAKIAVPAVQYPSATSFDAVSDIMVMKPVALNYAGEAISYSDLQFKRTLATLKLVLNSEALGGEALKSVSVTTNDPTINFAGNAHFDLATGELVEFYEDASTMVTAEPTADVFANGEDFVLINIPAMSLAAGTELTISGTTESYTFTRTVEVPASGMTFKAGTMFRLGMAITEVEENGSLSYDETLNNEMWLTDKGKVAVSGAIFECMNNGVYFSVQLPNYTGMAVLFIPYQQIGKEFEFVQGGANWDVQFEMAGTPYSYYYGAYNAMNNIVEGKAIASIEQDQMTFKLAILFDDGKIGKLTYSGNFTDYNNVGVDMTEVEYDEALTNQYRYDGQTYDINWSGFRTASGIDLAFLVSTSTPVDGNYSDAVEIQLPVGAYGIENYAFLTNGSKFNWVVDLFMNDTHIGGERGIMGSVAGGKAYITKSGNDIVMKAAIEFTDGKTLQVKYSGTAENLDPVGEGSYNYNGTDYTILGAGLKTYDDPNRSVEFVLHTQSRTLPTFTQGSFLQNNEHCVMIMLPRDLFGAELLTMDIAHTEYLGSDLYAFAYNGAFGQGIYYEGDELSPWDWQNGWFKVTKTGDKTYDIEFYVDFIDGKSISGSYSGSMWNVTTSQIFPDSPTGPYGRIDAGTTPLRVNATKRFK